MDKKEIQLEVLSVSNSQIQAGAYALLLGEVGGGRRLPVIIGAGEVQALMISMKEIHPPRPLTHQLFASVIEAVGAKLTHVLIYKVENGIFFAYLFLLTKEEVLRVDARTSDAIILAMRLDAPIFIDEEILDAECLREEHLSTAAGEGGKPKVGGNPFPEADMDALQSALKQAIDEENYELAAKLRDRINRQNPQS